MKTFVFFSLPFFLFSCTTDLLEQENTIVNNSENIELLTRAGDIDFNPLSELKDIPVYIINTGNTQNQYLTAHMPDNPEDPHAICEIDITQKNDTNPSYSKQWNITANSYLRSAMATSCDIYIAEESHTYAGPIAAHMYLQPADPTKPETRPITSTTNSPYSTFYCTPISGTPYYTLSNIYSTGGGIMRSSMNTLYLQSSGKTGNAAKFSTQNNSQLSKWSIQPVGEYEVVNIQYMKTAEDIFTRSDQVVYKTTIKNDRNTDITYHLTISGNYSESTTSSQTEGVTVSVSQTSKIGLPIISAEGSVSSSETTSKTWSFGETEDKTLSINHTLDIPMPPHTDSIVDAYMVSHTGTVSFIATLKKIDSNKQFRVKGKWTGVTVSEFHCEARDIKNGSILKSEAIPINEISTQPVKTE